MTPGRNITASASTATQRDQRGREPAPRPGGQRPVGNSSRISGDRSHDEERPVVHPSDATSLNGSEARRGLQGVLRVFLDARPRARRVRRPGTASRSGSCTRHARTAPRPHTCRVNATLSSVNGSSGERVFNVARTIAATKSARRSRAGSTPDAGERGRPLPAASPARMRRMLAPWRTAGKGSDLLVGVGEPHRRSGAGTLPVSTCSWAQVPRPHRLAFGLEERTREANRR